ncbi:recombinase RecA, partial [Nanoarchaeota archaeon]
FRRILKELDRIFYKGGIAAILVEDMESSWPITVGMSECAIHLDILKTPVGYQRALRIIKRYGVEHTLNWIPFEVTRRGVELKDREYFEMDTSTIQV